MFFFVNMYICIFISSPNGKVCMLVEAAVLKKMRFG